MVSC
ncbi:UNVERIFIED_CONTAM: hypothetical protein GTU68_059837 [Idotea baltica]|jgi:PAT family acetyl-CoA transporter-like MFS transporter 1